MEYRTQGTCSSMINFDIEEIDGRKCVKNVKFYGGCNGNLQGIGALVENMPVTEVIARLGGIRCGYKPTSCPDQLAKALQNYI